MPRPAGAPPPLARTHRVRSAAGLIVLALVLGLALAATLGGIVWAVALALHAAATA
ncbi:MAG TPA: hypothetical protein VFN68_00455 [Acidimicrobiales bacterium]|nr:hypothetical protein [Acidimicrobiales bacterium]